MNIPKTKGRPACQQPAPSSRPETEQATSAIVPPLEPDVNEEICTGCNVCERMLSWRELIPYPRRNHLLAVICKDCKEGW